MMFYHFRLVANLDEAQPWSSARWLRASPAAFELMAIQMSPLLSHERLQLAQLGPARLHLGIPLIEVMLTR